MSQEKVDKRKVEKANRKKQLEKKKQKRLLGIFVSVIATVAFLAVICLAIAQLSGKLEPEKKTEAVSYTAEELESLREMFGINNEKESESGTSAKDETTTSQEEGTTASEENTTAAE